MRATDRDQGDLFTAPDLSGMVRRDDHETSIEAAEAIAPKRSPLQCAVLGAFIRLGRMTDAELEALPEFGGFAYSTVRKRRTELFQDGLVEETGEKRARREGKARLKVWKATTEGKREAIRLGLLS
jgi:hypothetical protein